MPDAQRYVRGNCTEAGLRAFVGIFRSAIRFTFVAMLLSQKFAYYPERKEPEFENKMHDVLRSYNQLEMFVF